MAECMDEFDEATPLRGTYCSRLTSEEYEEQSASCTEQALDDLMKLLDSNPDLYKSVLKKRRKEEKEEEGLMAYFKVKLWSLVGGEDASCSVSDLECQEELIKLKTNMMRAHSYSQESKGRRFSKRLAEKRRLGGRSPSASPSATFTSTPRRYRKKSNFPPPPPPPPPPLHLSSTATTTLRRQPLAERNSSQHKTSMKKPAGMEGVLGQLKGSECRKRLKTRVEKSPGGTPLAGWAKPPPTPDVLRQFNQLLVDKFRNVKTPSPCYVQASPGTYDSPVEM